MNTLLRVLCAACALAIAMGCATRVDRDAFQKQTRVGESIGHTEGQALLQRKRRMERAQRDLMHIQRTLESLRRHRYDEELLLFSSFVRPYLDERVDPLFSNRRQGWHPELVALDANLLFAKGAVLAELRDRRALGELIRRIDRRFDNRDSLLVEYPRGHQASVRSALASLREARASL